MANAARAQSAKNNGAAVDQAVDTLESVERPKGWTIKNVPQSTREEAKRLAYSQGQTLGAWVNALVDQAARGQINGAPETESQTAAAHPSFSDETAQLLREAVETLSAQHDQSATHFESQNRRMRRMTEAMLEMAMRLEDLQDASMRQQSQLAQLEHAGTARISLPAPANENAPVEADSSAWTTPDWTSLIDYAEAARQDRAEDAAASRAPQTRESAPPLLAITGSEAAAIAALDSADFAPPAAVQTTEQTQKEAHGAERAAEAAPAIAKTPWQPVRQINVTQVSVGGAETAPRARSHRSRRTRSAAQTTSDADPAPQAHLDLAPLSPVAEKTPVAADADAQAAPHGRSCIPTLPEPPFGPAPIEQDWAAQIGATSVDADENECAPASHMIKADAPTRQPAIAPALAPDDIGSPWLDDEESPIETEAVARCEAQPANEEAASAEAAVAHGAAQPLKHPPHMLSLQEDAPAGARSDDVPHAAPQHETPKTAPDVAPEPDALEWLPLGPGAPAEAHRVDVTQLRRQLQGAVEDDRARLEQMLGALRADKNGEENTIFIAQKEREALDVAQLAPTPNRAPEAAPLTATDAPASAEQAPEDAGSPPAPLSQGPPRQAEAKRSEEQEPYGQVADQIARQVDTALDSNGGSIANWLNLGPRDRSDHAPEAPTSPSANPLDPFRGGAEQSAAPEPSAQEAPPADAAAKEPPPIDLLEADDTSADGDFFNSRMATYFLLATTIGVIIAYIIGVAQ